jgi:hypothetical protein
MRSGLGELMQVFALIDYDNVKPYQQERAATDVEANLLRIAEHVTAVARDNYPGTTHLELRLYGGWTDRMDGSTASSVWMDRVIHKVRKRFNRIRVVPEIAVSNYDCSLPRLVGLYRDGGQKMVDTLIVADLITLTHEFECPVLLLSEDDDMIPGLVAARSAKRNLTLVRNRSLGEGMNDHVVGSLNLQISGGMT